MTVMAVVQTCCGLNIYSKAGVVLVRSQARKSVPSWSIRGRSDLGGFNYYNLKAGNPGPASYATVKPSVYKRHAASAGFTIPGRHNPGSTI